MKNVSRRWLIEIQSDSNHELQNSNNKIRAYGTENPIEHVGELGNRPNRENLNSARKISRHN